MIVINRNPTRRQLIQFSVIGLLLLSVLGGFAWYSGREMLAYICCLAAVLFGFGLLSKSWAQITYSTAVFITYPIGFVLSYVVLGAIYFLVITPTGLLSRLFGRDPLAIRPKSRESSSHWKEFDHAAKPSDYFKQF